jgi:hypothetical protein
MKIAKKVPLIRIEDTLVNLEYLVTAWYEHEGSYGQYALCYALYNNDTVFHITFRTKKAAIEALDQIMLAIDIPIIEEDES